MPIHPGLDKINCCIAQKGVSERAQDIQEAHGKKNCAIININTKILHNTAKY
jgi:hypothetical protein